MLFVIFAMVACTPTPDAGECPEDCGVSLEVVPPDSLTGTLVVRSNPPGYAFGGDLLDSDGNRVVSINGLSEVAIDLLPGDLVAGETYTVDLGYACTKGAAQPACENLSTSFEAVETGVTTTTPTDGTITDTFTQVTTPEVDVLFVVDNSCSMSVKQADLVDNFPAFISFFVGSGLDFHVGVVSTDMDAASHSGKLRSFQADRWIDSATPNPSAAFAAMAQLGTSGSGTERGIGAAYTALEIEADAYNAGFLRDTSSVHVIVLSDERDYTSAATITVPEFINWFDGFRPDEDDTTFSSIVTLAGPNTGTAYIQVTEAVGGVVHDITDADYTTVLEQLGIQASGLKREFFLSSVPEPETIEVSVVTPGGVVLAFEPPEYGYDQARNSIIFLAYVPEPLSQIVIHYQPAN